MVISLKYHVPRGARAPTKSPRNGGLTNHFVNLSKNVQWLLTNYGINPRIITTKVIPIAQIMFLTAVILWSSLY